MPCYTQQLLIQKMLNGNIALYDNVTGDILTVLSPDIARLYVLRDKVKIIQDNGSIETIDTSCVAATQVLPAAAVPFVGDADALALLLGTDFFFELVASGGYPISYPVGFYTNFNHVSTNISSNFVAANYYYGAIQEVLKTVSISAPRVRVPGAVAGNGIVALYKYNGTQWVLVDQTGAFDTAVGGVAVLAWSTGTLVLQPGIYCWCTNTSGGNSFETIITALSNSFGMINTMSANSLSLQLHPSVYTGTALATMPMALSSAGFVPNILNLIM